MNPSPAENPPKEVISDKDYTLFVDQAIVSEEILKNIINKQLKGYTLSRREIAIVTDKEAELKKITQEKKDSEPKIDTLEEKIKNMTQEDIKKLEEEKKLLLEEEEKGVAKISSLEQKIAEKEAKVVVLENEGKENSADKQAEIDRRKKEIESEFTKQFSKEKRTELEKTLTAELQNSRMRYVEAYKEKVDSKKNWFGTKLKHWIGYKHRDTIVEKDSDSIHEAKQNYLDNKIHLSLKGEEVQQNLINARIEKLKAEGKDQTVIDAYKQRAQKAYDLYMAKKTGEVYDVTKKEINTIWEEKKGVANKFAEKAGEYIFHKPLLRHTIGNKWFRFATISAAYVASGASLAFVANRAVRFVGGNIIGASAVKMVLNKLYNEEKMLREGMSILEELYSKNRTDQETNADKIWLEESYINNRRRIEIELNSIKRLKETIIISAGLTTGMIASDLDQQFHISDTVGEKIQNISETTTVTDGNTQIEMNNTVQQKSFADTLREGSKPTVDSTDPAQQGGMNDTAKAAAQEGTSPETQTTAPTEAPEKHAIVEAGSGKGFEHSFRAQIEHNKVLAAKLKELYHYEGDISSTEGLHKFSGIAAHKMALAEGYVSTDGSERFIHGTVAPEIEIEGNEVVIHERVLNNGKWIDMDTADRASGHFETGVDRDPSGNIYEKTHMGSHTNIDHPHSQLKTHVEHLRESIVKAYTEEPEYLIEDKPKIDLHTTLEKPSAVDLPPPTKNVIDLPPPTKTVIDLPPPTVTPQPTVPVQNVQPSFVPPSTRPDPMYNQRFQMGTPGRRTLLENLFSKNTEGNELGQNIAMNSVPAQKDFLTILLEGFFGPETPSAPVTPPNPLETGGNGPMTA